MTPLFIFILLKIYFQFQLVSAQDDGRCPTSFSCGYLGQINFPFTVSQHPYCGALEIHHCENATAPKTIQLGQPPSEQSLIVTYVDHDTVTVRDETQWKNLQSKNCHAFNNFTVPPTSPLASFYIKYNISIFKCNHSLNVSLPSNFTEYTNCRGHNLYYDLLNSVKPSGIEVPSSLAQCTQFLVAIKDSPTNNPFEFLSSEITIEVQLSDDCNKCLRHRGGRCQLGSQGKFHCAQEDKRLAWKLGLGIGLLVIIITGLLVIWRCNRRVPNFHSNKYIESDSVYHGVPVFSFKDLEVATKFFDRSRELGEGGFGTVYYGKLKDGREVAVKRLYQHNFKRVEQFMNEIKILTRLHHRNLVTLYGCTSHQSHELLLVYEYVSNGTVASHLRGESGFLPWHIRMKVALETATALAYLHASEIIHRDVKTNNILLDDTFCIKVADFGLSKLFPNDVTHVSTAPQGTPGYVDPEYHQSYRLTSKSDVYSFGVVLVELISSMPAVDMSRDKEEINLANLAIRKIQKSKISELVDPSLGFESDSDVKRKIISIAELAFQCLQRDKELRPSMDEVLEVLRRIENGSGGNEFGHVDEVIAGISRMNLGSMSPTSSDHVEMNLSKNEELRPSPKGVTDKWDSESTTPNISGQSASQM